MGKAKQRGSTGAAPAPTDHHAVEDRDFAQRLRDVSNSIDALTDSKFDVIDSNYHKTRLYSQLELLYTEWQEAETAEGQLALNTKLPESIEETFEEGRRKLRLSPVRRGLAIIKVVRMIFCLVYVACIFLPFLSMVPLRILHPVARAVGIPNRFMPVDVMQLYVARGLVRIMGIQVQLEGEKNVLLDHATLGFFTHASNLDPLIVGGFSPLTWRWIAKKQFAFVPFLGILAWSVGMIFIDRSNRTKAIASLNSAATSINKHRRSVAIAPEGTRSTTGLLQPFKKGPFYLAQACKVPMQPILLFGAHELWPPKTPFPSPGTVFVRYLPPVPYDDSLDHNEQLMKIRKTVLRSLGDPPNPRARYNPYNLSWMVDHLFVVIILIAGYHMWPMVWNLIF